MATVIGTVRHTRDLPLVDERVCAWTVALDDPHCVDTIRGLASGGVDRVIEVSLSDNVELDTAVVANGAVIAAYASRADYPAIPFWPMLFSNTTLRLMGSDDFSIAAKIAAAQDLTEAAADAALLSVITARFWLDAVSQPRLRRLKLPRPGPHHNTAVSCSDWHSMRGNPCVRSTYRWPSRRCQSTGN